jgi:hypothetical protein
LRLLVNFLLHAFLAGVLQPSFTYSMWSSPMPPVN